MNIIEAAEAMKQGKCVGRIIDADTFYRINRKFGWIERGCKSSDGWTEISRELYIDLDDLLATDWEIVE